AFGFRADTPDSVIGYAAALMPPQPLDHWFPTARAMYDWAATELKPALRAAPAPIGAINATNTATNAETIRRYAPSFVFDTIEGVGHAGILLERNDDFDAKLLAMVRRFAGDP